jgi:hypothetical protein
MKLMVLGVVLVVGGAWAAGPAPLEAQPRPRGGAPLPRATPQPGYILDSTTVMAHRADFKAYIRSLAFDTSLTGADRRVLMQSRAPGSRPFYIGPKAELAPEIGAGTVTGNWATWGRVVARITLWSDSAYAPAGFHFHLQAGVTYLAVRMVPGRPDSLMGYLIAVARDTSVVGVEPVQLRVLYQPGPARFILMANDDGICTPCDSKVCCPT